jgi:hypothetical protein
MCVPSQPDQNEAPSRLCESCFHTLPLTEFRRRKRGSEHRMRQCRRCHNEFERYRRAAVRARLSKRRMAKDLSQVRDAASANRVKALCAEVVRGYGGAEGFAKAWVACLHRDLQRGGFAALRHLEATIRLIQHCEQDRPDYSQMSDEELEAMLASLQ